MAGQKCAWTDVSPLGTNTSSHFSFNSQLRGIKHLRSTWLQTGVIQIAAVTSFFILPRV